VVINAQDSPDGVEEAIWGRLSPLLRTAGMPVA